MHHALSYFRVSLELWRRQWLGILIAIAGLAVAFAVSLIAALYSSDGLTSDGWLDNSDRLYRVESLILANQQKGLFSRGVNSYETHADLVRQTFTEIEALVRIEDKDFFLENGKKRVEQKVYFADETLFDVLNFPLLAGDPATALSTPNSLIINESRARNIFGAADASIIGKTITLGQQARDQKEAVYTEFKITAVIKDIPSNSTFDYEFITRWPENPKERFNTFPTVSLFILLKENALYQTLKPRFDSLLTENTPPVGNYSFEFYLEPLVGALMNSTAYTGGKKRNIDKDTLKIISTLAGVLLLTAGINYVNVFTAINTYRLREMAIRRIAGAEHRQIVYLYMLEGMILAGIAYLFALILAEDFKSFFEAHVETVVPVLNAGRTPALLYGFLAALIIGALGATYPALKVLRTKTENLLRNIQSKALVDRGRIPKVAVAVQSFFTVAVIIGAVQMDWQLQNTLALDRGFRTNGVFYINAPGEEANNAFKESFLNEVRSLPGVTKAESTSEIPFANSFRIGNFKNPEQAEVRQVVQKFPGPAFLSMLSTPPLAYNQELPEENAIVLPASSARKFGFLNPAEAIGKVLEDGDRRRDDTEETPKRQYRIVAVIEDIGDGNAPTDNNIAYMYHVSTIEKPEYIVGYYDGVSEKEITNLVKAKWDASFPDSEFRLEWLKDRILSQLTKTENLGLVLQYMSIITIILSIAGLYAMARHWLKARERELALRRVMGARQADIMLFSLKKMMLPVIMGGLLALVPIWYVLKEWLLRFTDKFTVSPLVYGSVTVFVIAVSSFILWTHVIRALKAHPADILYHE